MIAVTFDDALRRPRVNLILAKIAQKRTEHPELAAEQITLEQLQLVATRERIHVADADLPRGIGGLAVRYTGACAITLSERMPATVRRLVLAHELAHAWLHLTDPLLRAWYAAERGCARSPIHERSEREADLFACALLRRPALLYRATLDAFFDADA